MTHAHLADMLRVCDHQAGAHILWADNSGIAHISQIDGVPAAWHVGNEGRFRFAFEAWSAGTDYVGPDAASDDGHVQRTLRHLQNAWTADLRGHLNFEDAYLDRAPGT